MWKPFKIDGVRYGGAPDHWLTMTGKRDLSGGLLTLDNGRFFLWEGSPGDSLGLVHRRGEKNASRSEAAFFAHCMGYEHDTPCGLLNRRGQRIVKPLYGAMTRDQYDQEMQLVAGAIFELRVGSGAVHFRRPRGREEDAPFDLPYTARYSAVAEAIHLYGTALWQVDPLSEFLHYYRVVERLGGGNGKPWVTNNIHRIASHDFGGLYLSAMLKVKVVNVFSMWRRRALARLKQLRLPGPDLAKYLYNTTRCGIAHGDRGVITIDFGTAIATAAKDLSVMKLLARIAIDDNASTRRTRKDDGKPDW